MKNESTRKYFWAQFFSFKNHGTSCYFVLSFSIYSFTGHFTCIYLQSRYSTCIQSRHSTSCWIIKRLSYSTLHKWHSGTFFFIASSLLIFLSPANVPISSTLVFNCFLFAGASSGCARPLDCLGSVYP